MNKPTDLKRAFLEAFTNREAVRAPVVRSLTIPTRNRPDALLRCVESFARNQAQHGRRVPILVVDSSDRRETLRDTADQLKNLERRCSGRIRHFTAADAWQMSRRLGTATGVDLGLLNFAFGLEGSERYSPGGNRNLALLLNSEAAFVSVDDDTVCSQWTTTAAGPLRITDETDPTCLMPQPSIDAIRRNILPVEEDFIAAHERVLGRSHDSLVREAATLDLSRASPAYVKRLLTARQTVVASWTGVAGDCGFDTAAYLYYLTGASRSHWVQSAASYSAILRSRLITRHVDVASIAPLSFLQTLAVGLDNTSGLVPFIPYGRGEDTVFFKLLRLTSTDACAYYQPTGVWHLPTTKRSFVLNRANVARPDHSLFDTFFALVTFCEPMLLRMERSKQNFVQTMRSVLADNHWPELVFELGIAAHLREIQALTGTGMVADVNLPRWRKDVERIKQWKREIVARTFHRREWYLRLIRNHGETIRNYLDLIAAWTEIVRAARRLDTPVRPSA